MNREDLLRHIADTGYNVGFGAKKHFATFDIMEKAPGLIAFVTLTTGVYALVFETLSTKFISATLVVLGILGIYISSNQTCKSAYVAAGIKLTQLFYELKTLYANVKAESGVSFQDHQNKLAEIEARYFEASISKQLFFSDWFAHYKFFWQHQIDWIDEQKNFRFLRDKIPLSLTVSLALALLYLVVQLIDQSDISSCLGKVIGEWI